MEITGRDILNLVSAVKIVETSGRGGYYIFSTDTKRNINSLLNEAVNKYREQLKEG